MTGFEHEYSPADPTQEDARRKDALLGSAAQARANEFVDFLNGGNARAEFESTHAHLTRSKDGVLGAMTGQQAAENDANRPMTVGSEWGETRTVERHASPYPHAHHLYGPGARITDWTKVNDQPGYQQGADRPILRHLRGER